MSSNWLRRMLRKPGDKRSTNLAPDLAWACDKARVVPWPVVPDPLPWRQERRSQMACLSGPDRRFQDFFSQWVRPQAFADIVLVEFADIDARLFLVMKSGMEPSVG